MSEFETVLRTPELGPGSVVHVRAHGRDVAVANVAQTYYAVDATCPVDGTDLGRNGRLEGDWLICPNDGSRFDIRTGERRGGGESLQSHAVQVEGNEIRVGPPRYASDPHR